MASSMIMAKQERRKANNFKHSEGDIKWTGNITIYLTLLAFVGGCLAGMLGIGGGLVFGPLFLELGLHAIVS